MRKSTIRIAAAAVILVAAAYVAGVFVLGSMVRAGINHFGPKFTQTRVVLDGATLSPLSGEGTLTGFYIGNPPGWSDGPALQLGKVRVKVEPTSLLGDHIIIDDVEIDQPEFTYETKVFSSNIGDLLKAVEGSSDSGAGQQTKAGNGKPLKFEVRKFRLSGGVVRIGAGPAAIPLPMPPLELDNLGTAEGGITSDQLAVAIMRSLAGGVVQATTHAAAKLGSTMGAATGSAVKNAADSLKGLFGGKSR